jgi:hypothetical protein
MLREVSMPLAKGAFTALGLKAGLGLSAGLGLNAGISILIDGVLIKLGCLGEPVAMALTTPPDWLAGWLAD